MKRKWKISAGNRTRQKNESGQKELAVPTAFPLASNITIIFSLIQQLQKKLVSLLSQQPKDIFHINLCTLFPASAAQLGKSLK